MSFGLESEQAVYASVCVWSLTCLLKTHKEIDQAHVWTAIVEIKQVVRLDGAHTHTHLLNMIPMSLTGLQSR